jgi:tryptophan-rich sensory protein
LGETVSGTIFRLLISILGCELAGFIGSLSTRTAIPGWYTELKKPAFSPPGAVFAPVWTLLYLLMGIAFFLVWQNKEAAPGQRNAAMVLFGIQLVLNALWTPIFFGLRSPLGGFVEIIALWFFIVWTIVRFYGISPASAYLMLPYIAWVSFALVLNGTIWYLNR